MQQYDSLTGIGAVITDLAARGGPVILVIMASSLLLWSMIVERYWFYMVRYPRTLERIAAEWNRRSDKTSWHARRIRQGMISELSVALRSRLMPIQSLTAILPLLGLLGTVTGMIATFDILHQHGSGNLRGLSSGISKALLPTTAGLVTAIAALFFSINLRQRAETEINRVRDRLI